MRLKVLTLRYDPEQGFDDSELQAFVQDRHVIAVSERFFDQDGTPVWALLISYRDPKLPAALKPRQERQDKVDWRTDLSEPDRMLYDALRTWRNDLAAARGIANYTVAKNRVLADIARLRPKSRTELMTISGIGERTASEYGDSMLQLVVTPLGDAATEVSHVA